MDKEYYLARDGDGDVWLFPDYPPIKIIDQWFPKEGGCIDLKEPVNLGYNVLTELDSISERPAKIIVYED